MAVLAQVAWCQLEVLDADYEALERPVSPTAPSLDRLTILAHQGAVWPVDDATDAMRLSGEVELRLGMYVMRSREAMLWLTRTIVDGSTVKTVQVFFKGAAEIIQPGGSFIEDEVLFVTIRTVGVVELACDAVARRQMSNDPLFRKGQQIRSAISGTGPVTVTTVLLEQPEVRIHTEERAIEAEPAARYPISFRGDFRLGPAQNGRRYVTLTNRVYVIQGAANPVDSVELQADSAVLFIDDKKFQAAVAGIEDDDRNVDIDVEDATEQLESATSEQIEQLLEEVPTEEEAMAPSPPAQQVVAQYVDAAYLEGDVVLTRGHRMVRASRLYYDFVNQRAVILDPVMRAMEPTRGLPIYVRAKRAEQLSERRFLAYDAKISASEFYTPSYHVGAARVYLEDVTERDETGRVVGLVAGEYEADHLTLNLGGVPLFYWPYAKGQFKQGESPLKSMRTGYRSDFGVSTETRWHLFDMLGLERPEGVDAELGVDYFSERGPGLALNVDYERDDFYGLYRGYYIHDSGEDELGEFRFDEQPTTEDRGRSLIRHRHYLPGNWELTLENSYISDPNFLEEYFKDEFDQGKEQESLAYLKRQDANTAFSMLTQWRQLDFVTQTEHKPDVMYDVMGLPLGDSGLTWYSENRAGVVRYRPDNRRFFDGQAFRYDNLGRTDHVVRADSRQELEFPLTLGPVKLAAFGSIRGTTWDAQPLDEGNISRMYGMYGVRGSTGAWRDYNTVESRLWDLHRLRHIVKLDATAWAAHSNVASTELTPFDPEVEMLDEGYGTTFGLRNIWQTKRGGPGQWQTVDWLTIDLEMGFFGDTPEYFLGSERNYTHGDAYSSRPEHSIVENFASTNIIWRLSDTTTVLYDNTIDLDHGRMATSNVSLAIDRTPRLAYFIGHRFIGETDSNLIGAGMNYRINNKYTLGIREQFDIERGKSAQFDVTLIRHMHKWYLAINLELDQIEDVDTISLAIWPEGVPQFAIGSRRYARMVETTGLRP